jgi:hypothetical protein
LKFPYSDLSLNQIYDLSFKHAVQLIRENGGEEKDGNYRIAVQQPVPVRLEQSFEGMYPVKEMLVRKDYLDESIKIGFHGNGIVVLGNVKSQCGLDTSSFVALLDVLIDGAKVDQVRMPYDYIIRKYDIYHKYLLKNGDHRIEIKWTNPDPDYRITLKSYVVYGDSPAANLNPNEGNTSR